jgi:hypothetical protein
LTVACDTIDSPAAIHPIPAKGTKVFVLYQGYQALLMGVHNNRRTIQGRGGGGGHREDRSDY